MDTEQRLWNGEAEITVAGNPEGDINTRFALIIDNHVHGFFPTYTQALEEAIKIVNDINLEDE